MRHDFANAQSTKPMTSESRSVCFLQAPVAVPFTALARFSASPVNQDHLVFSVHAGAGRAKRFAELQHGSRKGRPLSM